MCALLLFKQHGVQNGHDPVLKGTVVAVGDQHVAHSVQALGPQILTLQVEVTCISGCHTLQPHCIVSELQQVVYALGWDCVGLARDYLKVLLMGALLFC